MADKTLPPENGDIKKSKKFEAWLRRQGASILPTTSAYEVARFIAHGQTLVVYRNRSWTISAEGHAWDAYLAFKKGRGWNAGNPKKPRTKADKSRHNLISRDGKNCFFCGEFMPEDDRTIEHLVSVQNGGPSHEDNLALAHSACNNAAGNQTLMQKIEKHTRARIDKALLKHSQ